MPEQRAPRSAASIVVLIDGNSAVIDRCSDGKLSRVDKITPRRVRGESDHMGDAPRERFHSGTRGETIRDTRNHAREVGRRQFAAEVAPRAADAATLGEWIVIGGNALHAHALRDAFPPSLLPRTIVLSGVSRTASAEELIERVGAAVAARSASIDLEDVKRLIELAGAHTSGVLGAVATLDAAEHGAVDVALMTGAFAERNAEQARQLLAATTAERGRIEFVSGAAAELLEKSGGGVGALLRFSLHAMPRPAGAALQGATS